MQLHKMDVRCEVGGHHDALVVHEKCSNVQCEV